MSVCVGGDEIKMSFLILITSPTQSANKNLNVFPGCLLGSWLFTLSKTKMMQVFSWGEGINSNGSFKNLLTCLTHCRLQK